MTCIGGFFNVRCYVIVIGRNFSYWVRSDVSLYKAPQAAANSH